MKHGVRADPWNLYESLDDTEQQWIDDLAARYRDLLGLDVHDARSDRMKRACIYIFQAWRGEQLILDEGMSTETVIAETDDGPVDREQTAFILDDFHRVQNPRLMDEEYFEIVLEKYDELIGHQIGEEQEVEQ